MAARAGFDLDRMSVPELIALRDAAEAQRREKLASAKEAVLAETTARLAELGLTLEEARPGRPAVARGRKARKDAGTTAAAKFRGPGRRGMVRARAPAEMAAGAGSGRQAPGRFPSPIGRGCHAGRWGI